MREARATSTASSKASLTASTEYKNTPIKPRSSAQSTAAPEPTTTTRNEKPAKEEKKSKKEEKPKKRGRKKKEQIKEIAEEVKAFDEFA